MSEHALCRVRTHEELCATADQYLGHWMDEHVELDPGRRLWGLHYVKSHPLCRQSRDLGLHGPVPVVAESPVGSVPPMPEASLVEQVSVQQAWETH